MMWGGELVLRDGEAVGQVTSAAWSETLGSGVALAYVWRRDGEAGHHRLPDERAATRSTSAAAGAAAVLHTRAPFDPDNIRIRR